MAILHRVGVIRGGKGYEYQTSLERGADILRHIDTNKFTPVDIFVDTHGMWHVHGVPTTPQKILPTLDVVFDCICDQAGEIKALIKQFGIPNAGSVTVTRTKQHRDMPENTSIRMPRYAVIPHTVEDFEHEAVTLWKKFPHPSLIKPVLSLDVSRGILAHTFTEFLSAIAGIILSNRDVLVEEYIAGEQVVTPIIPSFRNQELYIPSSLHKAGHLETKEHGALFRPSLQFFSEETRQAIEREARELYKSFDMSGHSVFHFTVSPQGVYLSGVDTLPSLTDNSPLAVSLDAASISRPHFLTHILEMVFKKR